jgi:sigma-B regulation protein RsbU (phosphoserine phosphatase)
VEEILLPSPPLGLLGQAFGERELVLAAGEAMVWLSDGMIEGRNAEGEPFGYERVERALVGPASPPEAVRDRLLAAVRSFTGTEPAEDDRTVVVLSYRPELPLTPNSS